MRRFFELSQLVEEKAGAEASYSEFLRIPSMSAGVYVLSAGAQDKQLPHNQDELYYIASGRARIRVGQEERDVANGSIVFVEALAKHYFHDIREELVVIVFFAPAESK
jgi:mannose-6-phosphate isomerase-like protein (cupin superfamily)